MNKFKKLFSRKTNNENIIPEENNHLPNINIISTDNYIYTIVYNTNASEVDKDFDTILNSFVPNDLIGAKNNPDFITFIVVLIAFIFAIIRIIKKYKKKN